MILIINFLIKIIFITLLTTNYLKATEIKSEKIIFKIDNKAFTTIDLENREKYYKLLFNNIEHNQDNILEDLISLMIFNEYFLKKNKEKKYNFLEVYKEIFQNYEKNNDDKLSIIYNELGKDLIIEYLEFDLNRKQIIEEIINTKKNVISNDFNDLDLLYDVNLKYYIIDKKNYNLFDLNENILSNYNENELKAYFKKNNIKYLYKENILTDLKNPNEKIKNAINSNSKNFNLEYDNQFVFGIIQKKLKTYEGINVQLVKLSAKEEIDDDYLLCNQINNIDKNLIDNITSGYYEYKTLNDLIKDNLFMINDYIQIKQNEIINYIILCELSFDKKMLNEITMTQKVNNLAYEIEKEFIKKYSKKFELQIINE